MDMDPEILLLTIPFGTSTRNHKEDDRVIHRHVQEFLDQKYPSRVMDITHHASFHNDLHNVAFLYEVMTQLDFLVCTRFHAHIFAIMTGTPFVSLSCSRKCQELMIGLRLQDLCFPLVSNMQGKPYPLSNPNELSQWMVQQYHKRQETRERLQKIWKHDIEPEYQRFEVYWNRLLQKHVSSTHDPPSSSPPS